MLKLLSLTVDCPSTLLTNVPIFVASGSYFQYLYFFVKLDFQEFHAKRLRSPGLDSVVELRQMKAKITRKSVNDAPSKDFPAQGTSAFCFPLICLCRFYHLSDSDSIRA